MTTHIGSAVYKGGSGKTTTALNLGHGLALRGWRVLMADTDRQGQCATGLGMDARPDVSRWLGSALFGAPVGLGTCVQSTRILGLDLLSGNSETERAQKMIGDGEYAPDYLKNLVLRRRWV
jgi:chromosome partitioning protein